MGGAGYVNMREVHQRPDRPAESAGGLDRGEHQRCGADALPPGGVEIADMQHGMGNADLVPELEHGGHPRPSVIREASGPRRRVRL